MSVSRIHSPGGIDISEIKPGKSVQVEPQQAGENTFQKALDALSQSQQESDDLIRKLAEGEDVDLHQLMIATTETDVNFRVALAIRDRLVEAYKEVMRMNV